MVLHVTMKWVSMRPHLCTHFFVTYVISFDLETKKDKKEETDTKSYST